MAIFITVALTISALATSSTETAIIDGSGLYQMSSLADKCSITIQTPYGSSVDNIILGELEGIIVAFLTRYGQGHKL